METSRGFEVELRLVGIQDGPPVGSHRARRGLKMPVVVWLAVLVSVVGVAGVGRAVGTGPQRAIADVLPVQPRVADAPSVGRALAPLPDVIVLSSPAIANAEITTRELTIRGYLASGTGTIRVTLEARGNRIIDEATIEPALAFAERPTIGRHAQFEARFGLPNPRPNGRMIVQVALLGEDGGIIDVIRRPIRVGRLIERVGA